MFPKSIVWDIVLKRYWHSKTKSATSFTIERGIGIAEWLTSLSFEFSLKKETEKDLTGKVECRGI